MDPETAGIIRGLAYYFRWDAWIEPHDDAYMIFFRAGSGDIVNGGSTTDLNVASKTVKDAILVGPSLT